MDWDNVNRSIKSKEQQIREIEEQLFLLRRSPLQNMQQINYLKIQIQNLQAEIKDSQQDL